MQLMRNFLAPVFAISAMTTGCHFGSNVENTTATKNSKAASDEGLEAAVVEVGDIGPHESVSAEMDDGVKITRLPEDPARPGSGADMFGQIIGNYDSIANYTTSDNDCFAVLRFVKANQERNFVYDGRIANAEKHFALKISHRFGKDEALNYSLALNSMPEVGDTVLQAIKTLTPLAYKCAVKFEGLHL